MNIISVEHLPSLAVCTKGTLRGASQNLKQGRCVPPLTIVSKGKAVTSNNVMVKGRTPTLTMVSKGNVVTCNAAIKDHLPPLTVVSKGRAVNNDAVVKDQLREAGLPPQLAVIQKTPSINMNSGKMSMVSDKFSKITGSSKKPLIVKTYKSISAPAPLFGPFKSRIPLASKTPSMLIDSGTNNFNDNSIGASNIDDPSVIIMDSSIGASNLDDPSVIIVESAVFSSKDDVIISEVLWAIKCCVSNFSFNSNEGNNVLFAKMFHDSKIASNYRMSYSKCQYVVEFALKPFIFENLCNDFRDTPFTFKFDETTTVQTKKQYDGYVQYYSNKFQRVINHYCGSLFLGHCTAQQLRDHFHEFGSKLKWNVNYLLHLGMDGPNVNTRFESDLADELKATQGKTMLNVSTCSLHPVHNALADGLKKTITFDFDKFASSVHTFFKRSAARREDYAFANIDSELEIHSMHRHVPSRWVSMKRAYKRIDEQWEHLQTYFLDFVPKQKNFVKDIEGTEKYKFITSVLKDKESLIVINFMIYLAGILESYLIPMESKSPKIHLLYTKMGELFHKLMSCFVKKSALLDERGNNKDAYELGRLDVSKHLKKIHEIEVGTKAKYLIANLEATKNLDHLKLQFRNCFVQVTTYLQAHLPHQSIFLKELVCLQPDERKRSASASSIRRVAIKIAKVLHNTKLTQSTPECYADEAMAEYKVYQSETFYFPVPETDPDADEDESFNIEDYWSFVGTIKDADGKLKFKNLLHLARICLSVSHGNADPERGFSENKHILEGRESLGEETIIAIRIIKESVRLHGGILNFPINRRLINLFENAKTAYDESQEMKKAQKALQEASKKKLNEDSAAVSRCSEKLLEIEKQISEEQHKIDAANSVLEEGQSVLQSSLTNKKVKKETVIKANALIKLGMENANMAKKKLVGLTEEKIKIMNQMKTKKKNL